MPLNSDNVIVAVTGAMSMAPTGTPAPTDATSPLGPAWLDLGYVHEDGITEARGRSSEQIRAWQNADVVREAITEATLTYELQLIETKAETVELFYGATLDRGDGSIPVVPAATGGRHSFVLDVVDGDRFIRTYLPSAEVTEVDEQEHTSGTPLGFPLTLTAYPGTAGYSAKKFYSALKTTPAATPVVGKAAKATTGQAAAHKTA